MLEYDARASHYLPSLPHAQVLLYVSCEAVVSELPLRLLATAFSCELVTVNAM